MAWVRRHELTAFFVLAYLIMYATLFGYMLLCPGQPMRSWTIVWAVSVFSPTISAVLISWLLGGGDGVRRLLSGFTLWRVGLRWYFWATFLLAGPLCVALVYILAGGEHRGLEAGMTWVGLAARMFTQLVAGPASEEAGWRGFALPRLQARYSALVASLILGVVWTFWHLPLFFLTGETQVGIPFPFYFALVVTMSVYLAWLYNNTRGSLIITTLGHWSFNLTGVLITGPLLLMPVGLFYATASPMLLVITVAAVVWSRPKHLSRLPETELPVPA